MPRFFIDRTVDREETNIIIDGEDGRHIERSLRMAAGEEIAVCDSNEQEHFCKITSIQNGVVTAEILYSQPCKNEASIKVTLYQALTKGDKMDTIIQKAVELGVFKIVPVVTKRCVSRPDQKSLMKKCQRWQKIAQQAAMQSHRGIIPEIGEPLDFKKALEQCRENSKNILFYEKGGEKISDSGIKDIESLGIFIGSEGGFDPEEVSEFLKTGGTTATLGKRILRAETAPLAALTIIMYETGNMD